jgi:glycosyltransferase involved in cell wall biosynthesis
LRVLTFLHSFEPGGLERDVLRFNGAWAAMGIDAQIVLGRNEGALAGDAPDVPFHLLPTGRISTARFETLWMIWHLPRLVRQLRPDVIFCAGNSYTIVAVALRLILGRACPPIVFRVSNDLVRLDMPQPIRAIYHAWLRFQQSYFAAIVGMAEPVRGEILAQMHANPERIVIIDNASMSMADIDRLAKARAARNPTGSGRHFVGIGRLVGQKNFSLLVRAFAKIARPDDRLTIVGEGPLRAAIEAEAAALGVAGQIAMPGHQSPIDGFLAVADAFVLSSDYEGVPAVIVEALAAGLPIVATDCCMAMPYMLDGLGHVVPPRDADALAAAMDRCLEVPVDPAAMRCRAERFTIEATGDAWQSLFERLSR